MLTSLQCGRQIAQLKEEYEEAKKILEAETTKLRQVGIDEVLMVKKQNNNKKICLNAEFLLQTDPSGSKLKKKKNVFFSLQNALKDASRHAEMAAERHTVAANRHGAPNLKGTCKSSKHHRFYWSTFPSRMLRVSSVPEEMGKPGSDAGMPAIEDSEVGKLDENHFGKSQKRK